LNPTFPFEVGLAFGATSFDFLVGAGGRGEAGRWESAVEPSSVVGDAAILIVIRELFGDLTKPCWDRAGLGGRRVQPDDLPGTWRLLGVEAREDDFEVGIVKIGFS
jgi:hypothetical protein